MGHKCAPCEISPHFLFDCDKYTDNREILFDSLHWLPSNINIDVKLLTKGSDFLTYEENTRINTFGNVCWFFRSFRHFVNLLEFLIYLKACLK
jgi:hypothetical protein